MFTGLGKTVLVVDVEVFVDTAAAAAAAAGEEEEGLGGW